MILQSFLLIALLGFLFFTFLASGVERFQAILTGYAVIPANSTVKLPDDAPEYLNVSGKYTHPDKKRRDKLGEISGRDRGRPRVTDINLPMQGQPLQGFSGIKVLKDGTALAIYDNGYGSAHNSPDAMLMFHHIKFDWKRGEVIVLKTSFLHDPEEILPFRIANEATKKRYLTGADLDPESIQVVGNTVYIGDEFGPYIVRADLNGKLTGFWELNFADRTLKSPQHYTIQPPSSPGEMTFDVQRSRGFESMAVSPDGRYLYPMLEAPVWNEETKSFESHDGKSYVRIFEFDTKKRTFGRSFKYILEDSDHSVTDFNLISDKIGLVIERDGGEGDASMACDGKKANECFDNPAKLKRVYKIDLGNVGKDGFVKKIAYIDLLDIDDPDGLSQLRGKGSKFTFPFETPESVDRYDSTHIVVSNDNNLGYSCGRRIGKNDDNEFILLEVGNFIKIRTLDYFL
ncbi:MAG: esterase-like activity of phytase family protein, partial [Candidatus Dadabacteria bacterium]|nr:esterase-like activity of phytase family protein [Candidatus Dadabacteria bacterium]